MDSFHLKPLPKKQFWGYTSSIMVPNDAKNETTRDIEGAFGYGSTVDNAINNCIEYITLRTKYGVERVENGITNKVPHKLYEPISFTANTRLVLTT
jgi:hypothetical protein